MCRLNHLPSGFFENHSDERVVASIPLATTGQDGDDLTPFAHEHLPWRRDQNFSPMTTPGLVVTGDKDDFPLTTQGRA